MLPDTTLRTAGGRRSPAVACWASDQWVASSNPVRGKFRHSFRLIIPDVCLAQFSLNNVHKRGLKHHHFIYIKDSKDLKEDSTHILVYYTFFLLTQYPNNRRPNCNLLHVTCIISIFK